jgi:hypothetical protein
MDSEPRWQRACLGVGMTSVVIALGGGLVALLATLRGGEKGSLTY